LASRRASLALVALALVACSSGVRPTVTAARELRGEDVRLVAEVMAMADARRFDSATVQRALASGTPYVRRTATLAIGQVGGRALAGTLRTLMTDADTGVAANAAFALGLLRDSASVGALAEAAVRPGPEAREAAWALGEIGEPARRVITGTLGSGAGSGYSMSPDGPRSVDARAGLLIAATKLRPVPVDAIRRYAATSTAGGQPVPVELSRAAAYAFGRLRVAAGVRLLLGLARSPDEETRAHVARGVALPAAGDSLADSAFAALTLLARDPAPHVRVNALRSLATFGPRARETLLAAAADSDANVRIALAQSLSTVPLADRSDWTRLWSADSGFTFRSSLVASALRAGVVMEALDPASAGRWQASGDWRYRAAAANAGGAATAPDISRFRSRATRTPGCGPPPWAPSPSSWTRQPPAARRRAPTSLALRSRTRTSRSARPRSVL
jgi:HEAT repeat protein